MSTTRRETGAWTKFSLLMWKNFLQQWRHRIQTLVEFLLPVLTMSLVLLVRSQIDPEEMSTIKYPPIPAFSLRFSLNVLGGMNISTMAIAYSPKNDILDDVLRSAVANLAVWNIRDLLPMIIEQLPPDINFPPELLNSTLAVEVAKTLIRVQPYDTSSELRALYVKEEATRRIIAAVEFPDEMYNATQLPLNLSYALRFPERPRLNSFYGTGGQSWKTDSVFPMFDAPGPRFPYSWEGGNDPGYVNEMFIALQHCISTELVTRITGANLEGFGVNINRFPHPPYVLDYVIETLKMIFPMFIMISFSYTATNIVRAVTVEKEAQLKETMKIMGLPTWLHWTAWFCKQFVYLLLSTILILVILKVNWFTTEDGFSNYAVFTHTPATVIFFFFMLYLICTILFCFMVSGFFSKASTAALFAGVIWFITYIPAFLLAIDVNMSVAMQAFTCLCINSAMAYGFQLMLSRESTGGLQWGEFWMSPSTDSSRFVFGNVVVMLVVDCVLYLLLALYLEQVMPGPFGTPKPWNFFLQKHFWFPNRQNADTLVIEDEALPNVTKEKDPTDLHAGVKISNLTKVYGNNIAVNNLSLKIYDDQITVLLGHNGAGKSTTISMLTGNLEITHGSVTVAGYDITRQAALARSHIGLCPQHNVLFNELTVKEHLEFFARLKGFKGKELNDEIESLISKLELEEKRDYHSAGLSGGQKRRLAVGVALCGAAKVVLLDEPTSGMDPASRRALWDLLQKEKKGRSMILTTHFMDEADILGDRVAIMANGQLHCVGSPYFLKSHYGVGYTLVVVKEKEFDVDLCTEIINKHIPGTTVKADRGREITYDLKNESSHAFEEMLIDLEKNINQIHFKDYGLMTTTLEDVFMKVGSDVATDFDDSATGTESTYDDTQTTYDIDSSVERLDDCSSDTLKGGRLIIQHILAMWTKLWLVWSRSLPLLCLQILFPVIQINATLGFIQWIVALGENIQRRELTLRESFTQTETLLNFYGSETSSIGQLAKRAYESMFLSANVPNMALTVANDSSLEDYYLNRTHDPSDMGSLRYSLLIGASFDDHAATVWFSNFGYHDIAISLAAVHAAILKAFQPAANLTVYNHPIEAQYSSQNNMQLMASLMSMQLSSGIGFSLAIVSAVFIMFYIKERTSRAKLLQKAAGISPMVMWGSAAIFDWLWYCIIVTTIIFSCWAFNVIGLSSVGELGRLYLLLIVYGAAMLPLVYVCSYFFKGPAVGFVTLFFTNVLVGSIVAQIVEALNSPVLDKEYVAHVLDKIFQFFPLYSLITATRSLNQVGHLEWSCLQGCDYIAAIMPNISECTMQVMCENFSSNCCVREDPWFEWEEPGFMRYITAMLISGLLMWVVLMVAEYRLVQKVFSIEKKAPQIDESALLDKDVADEAAHARAAWKGPPGEQSLVANGLTKYYGKNLAVDQVSFTVGDTECFGLLGVNGAGKTTTFKMLMGDETISSGDALVAGYSVKTNITKVYENIGYCPQFDAIFGELTGRENLKFFSMLRGFTPRYTALQTEVLAHALGFTKHLDKQVKQYSGGNKRKLSTAVALLGRTRLVFVDEPTTGVDPAAKRQVWRAIRSAQKAGRGVVLTSHSMEECEALCSRLTIMVNGRFQCLGTPQHLKNQFSQGFTLTIKMKVDDTTNTASPEASDAIKNNVSSNFRDPKIMEEYQGLLTYYLPDTTVAWSRMFGIMERAKRDLEIEDYSISQTTLEQIFLQFTKYQKEG